MSDENGQEIGLNVSDEDELIEEDDGEEAASTPQPSVEVFREEIVTVTKNSDTEDNDTREDDLYEVVKTHSDQISRLTDIVESLQSQIKQIDHQRGGGSGNKASYVRRNRSITKTEATSKKPKGKSSKRK
jgi:hypothetical protein